jgi:hypothetical protein
MEAIWEFLQSPVTLVSRSTGSISTAPRWAVILGFAAPILVVYMFIFLEERMPWQMAFIFVLLFLATLATIFAR